MKVFRKIPFFVALVSFLSCSPAASEETPKDKLSFSQNELSVFETETIQIPVSYEVWDRGVYTKSEYDFASNPHGVVVFSSDKSVAEVIDGRMITGIKEGTCVLTLSAKDIDTSGQLVVYVKKAGTGAKFTQDITQQLSADMIALPIGLSHTTMQGLDVDKRGVFYMSWEEDLCMYVRAFNKDGSSIGKDMTLPSGGHGDGFSIEYNNDEVYFWTSGTLGEHLSNGGWSGGKAADDAVRLICRHKFVSGATQYAEDAEECFYLNSNGCRFVEVDTEHDVMACWTYESGKDYFYVYKLSDIRKGGKIKKTVTRTSHNNGAEVQAFNLNDVTPVAKFSWVRMGNVTGSTNSGAVQGICVYDDKIYVESGAKNDDATLISVLDFHGNILQKQIKVGVTIDKQRLKDFNLSSDGTFEPEGIHIRNGEMYMGFVGDYPTVGSKKHACIIKLK